MKRILVICIGFVGMTCLASPHYEIIPIDDLEDLKQECKLDQSQILSDLDLLSFSVSATLLDRVDLTSELGDANDEGFTGFKLSMDLREHPRIRDDLVQAIHETVNIKDVSTGNPTIRSPVNT